MCTGSARTAAENLCRDPAGMREMENLMTIIDQSWYERPPAVADRLAAGGVVVRREGERILVGYARVKGYDDLFLPKGGVEEGESNEMAARREIAEEMGVTDLTLLANLGTQERLSYSKQFWNTIHYFLYLTTQIEVAPLEIEIHPFGPTWRDLEETPILFWPEQVRLIEENRGLIREKMADYSPA